MTRDGVPGLGGTLLSPRAAAEWLRAQADERALASGAAAVAEWAARTSAGIGPSATERRLLDSLVFLFERAFAFTCRREGDHAVAATTESATIVLVAFGWGRPLTPAARRVLRPALDAGARWAAAFNGRALAIVDARDGSPRRIATIGLEDLAAHEEAALLTAALLDARAFAGGAPSDAAAASDRSSFEVTRGLREGVNTSLAALGRELPFDASLAVLFRLLFVLFAEARSLVPVWHRIYRDHYALAGPAARRALAEPRGAWAWLEAGRRLLGEGCRAGTLRMAGFNGRLFAPGPVRRWAASPHLDSRLDAPAAEALASLVEYRPARGGARRVSYAELDVEELGSIYERVLDLDPAGDGRARKESGSFYTPRALTEFIARRTLAPLVDRASSERILSLRVVDPAMGSGAFLVAALRFLSSALEAALVREGALPEHDVLEGDRQQLRRLVAQRCLYGVDANPTAAMLARLSLWLATLSSDRPLGFLDHRLKCGDSLIGADPALAGRAPGRARARFDLPLFDASAPLTALSGSAARSHALSRMAEDTLEDVRRKQKRFEALASGAAGTAKWRSLCDAWCAWWFVAPAARMDAREYRALADALVRGSRVLSRRGLARRLREAAATASSERFFHWPLEFPEVFAGGAPGFDAVIGNPPWEMLRAGAGSLSRDRLKTFARGSGAFPLAAGGHINLYQLFVERSLGLARHGGRIGMVVPWGLMTDDGSALLRTALFDGTRIDTLARFDNRDGVFQAHRSLRFAALTTTVGEATPAFELTRLPGMSALDDLPDCGDAGRGPALTRHALELLGGRGRRVPDVPDSAHLALALKLAARHRGLGDPLGWGASFGRELNLTDDRRAFTTSGMPVLEGKHLHPFRVDADGARHRITRAAAARLLPSRPFDSPRLAYRDVTAQTNRQTLIAAIVPAGMVTSHSLFCLRNGWDLRTQRALCLILNSSVANFLMRLFVSSHVTTSLMAWLPVPDRGAAVDALADFEPGAAADARVRALYGLTKQEAAAI